MRHKAAPFKSHNVTKLSMKDKSKEQNIIVTARKFELNFRVINI